ncbi:helix-turn-helix domain-containing protein [Chitinophaga pinensis]|uniref:Transcriptional regulator, AraC family n=1 Tax=Chitinophaga pinensis (strain ATCC 43595 / DSM 2588 / LMG 13176 / NBRC 15968 / NCIMB 11800 / UQM 2034) TaxID=485918 RepID=A0A979GVC3_CHIPD|nr:helix-turn-helix domain-containing protein [Chitinophaga pinensis]ACU59810.1 transcriptional regulator, AraC family [Chitinophaga pinensis DSM 2588]
MYLFSADSIEFFRELHSPSDVPKRFASKIMHHSSKVLHGDQQKTIFLQRIIAGFFEIFEHHVVCNAQETEILPTPLTPSLHLHVSMDDNEVDAYVNGQQSVDLKPREVNLFYLEEINIAVLPPGKHCFFHIAFKNDTLFRLLKKKPFAGLYNKYQKKVKQVEEEMGGMINEPGQVSMDAYFMMLIHEIRQCNFNEAASRYYREKKCQLMLEHFIRQILYIREPKIELTDQKILTLDYVKEYVKLNINKPVNLKQLAGQFNISTNLLEKGFRQLNGISLRSFIHMYRMEFITKLLAIKGMPHDSIARLTGFRNYAALNAAFYKYFGCNAEVFHEQC